MESLRLLKYIVLAIIVIVAWGTIGYVLIEGASLMDALYMTVITIATVGFGEVFELSQVGKAFTIILIIAGTGIILVSFGVLTQIALEGSLRRIMGRKRVEKEISKLKKHYIIGGSGRIGGLVVDEMRRLGIPFVIIENDPERAEQLSEQNILVIHGNATEEEVLEKANIMEAKGIVVTVSSDAEAVFIILSARNLNPDLFVIARAIDDHNERKLKQAGANRVISPYRLVGKRMTNAILRPAVIDMLDTLMFESHLELAIEGTEVYSNSLLAGLTLRESGIREKLGLIIIGIQKANGNILFNPDPEEKIAPGDALISIGENESIRRLADWLSGKDRDLL